MTYDSPYTASVWWFLKDHDVLLWNMNRNKDSRPPLQTLLLQAFLRIYRVFRIRLLYLISSYLDISRFRLVVKSLEGTLRNQLLSLAVSFSLSIITNVYDDKG